MRSERVARRYAEALLQTSVEQKDEERIAADVRVVDGAIKGSRELLLLLKSPVVKSDKKQQVLTGIFQGKVSEIMLRFLLLITEKGRESSLPAMIRRFDELRDERLGIVSVEIASAVPLTETQSAALTKRFEDLTKKKVRASLSVLSALRGGFRARLGDTVFDGSVQRQLEIIRQRFLEGNDLN